MRWNRIWIGLGLMACGMARGQDTGKELYVGTAGGWSGSGAVYRYRGGTDWENLSSGRTLGAAVMDLEMYGGRLYAATQSQSGYGGWGGTGRVWRHDEGSDWTQVGELGTSATVLLILDDVLYCGVTDLRDAAATQKLYRYEGEPGKWTLLGSGGGLDTGFRAGAVSSVGGRPEIHIGEIDADVFHRYNADEGLQPVQNFYRSCVYSMKATEGALYAGCWHGSFYRTIDGRRYEQLLSGYDDHIWALETFQGNLYAGTGRASCTGGDGRLLRWDEAARAMVPIRSWPAASYAEGVTSLAAAGSHLYVGLGMPDGYYAGNGTAEVWSYDGLSFERICPPDFFGGGVQTMLAADPPQPRLAILDVRVIPPVLKPGGSALVIVKAAGAGVTTSKESLKITLPAGWTTDPIEGSADGMGVFAAAVFVPCEAQTGDTVLRIRLKGRAADGTSVVSGSREATLSVNPDLSDAKQLLAAETVQHLRAFNRNLTDPATADSVPSVLDLTAYGFAEPTMTVKCEPASSGVVSRFAMTAASWTTTPYEICFRYASPYIGMYGTEATTSWTSPSYSGSYSYVYEPRAYLSFAPAPPAGTLGTSSARLKFQPLYTAPSGSYPGSLNLLQSRAASRTDSDLFADAGDGAHAALTLTTGSTVQVEVTAVLNQAGFGIDLQENDCPVASFIASFTGGETIYTTTGKRRYLTLGSPILEVVYRMGVSPARFRRNVVDALLRGDVQKYRDALIGLNRTYGRTAAERGFVPYCARLNPLVLAKTLLTLEGTPRVAGDAHSDGRAVVNGAVTVDGTLSAVRDIRVNGRAAKIGRLAPQSPPLYPSLETVLGQVGTTRRINGNLTITEQNAVQGVLYVNGNVTITGRANITATIIATGDVHVLGNARLTAAAGGWAVYSKSGKVRIGGTSQVLGRVAGPDVTLSGTAYVGR